MKKFQNLSARKFTFLFTGNKMSFADIFHSSVFIVCRPSGWRGDSLCFPTSGKHNYCCSKEIYKQN